MELRHLDEAFTATDGVFTLPMLSALGVAPHVVKGWRASGRIVRICGQAFIRSGRLHTVHRRAVGACLTWPDAIVCLTTAAQLHGVRLDDGGAVDVLVPSPREPVDGVRPHFWSVRPTGVVRRGPLVMTDRSTTLCDCLGRMDDVDAWGLLALLFTRERITARDIEEQLADRRRMHGVVRLRAMAGALVRRAVSLPEVELQRFLEQNRITGWTGNAVIRSAGRIVARADVGFLGARLVLEYDGAVAHGPERRRSDARRDARLRDIGFEVLRVDWVSLNTRRRLLRDTVRALVRERGSVRRAAIALAWNERRYRDLDGLLSVQDAHVQ